MSEARCDKCKYWINEEYPTNPDLKVCSKAKPLWECSEWNDDMERVMLPEFKDLKMFVQDGSDYRAIMLTRSDFFCAHFEEKIK